MFKLVEDYRHNYPNKNVKDIIEIFISQHEREYTFKVGITGRDPVHKYWEYSKYDRMILVYSTTSDRYEEDIKPFSLESHKKLKDIWLGVDNLEETGEVYVYFILNKIKVF